MMVDLERLDEALTWDLEYVAAIAKGDPDLTFEPLEVIVNAARAYRDMMTDAEKVRWCGLAADYMEDDRDLERCVRAHLFVGCGWRLVVPLREESV